MLLAKRNTGWIGVDLGTAMVKVAQVARTKDGWQLESAAVVPRSDYWPEEYTVESAARSSLHEIRAAQSLQDGFRGRQVAAALPMALCEVHRHEKGLDQEPNVLKTLCNKIETTTRVSLDHFQCDYWSAPARGDQPGWTQTLVAPRTWTQQVCSDVSRAGWSCAAVDGIPHALARAVSMVSSGTSPGPIAAFDWGHNKATVCFIEQEQPAYVRCLKSAGFRNILLNLTEKLHISELDAQRLLEQYGLSASDEGATDEIAQLVYDTISDSFYHVVDELKRSIEHYRYLRRASAPKQMYLFGGGALIKQIGQRLTERLAMRARVWQLCNSSIDPPTDAHSSEYLFASAIALSAMAWEDV